MTARPWQTGLVLAAIVSGCVFEQPEPSDSRTGPNRLRTFTWVTEQDGVAVGCPAFAAEHPVSGNLRGAADDLQEPLWLEGQGGVRLSIVWPAGFSVSFEPDVVLRNERGAAVAVAGDSVELGQVDAFANAGTFGDPYVASGLLFDGCYRIPR